MDLKKNSKSLDSEQKKSEKEDVSLVELNNLDNKTEIKSQPLEVSKANEMRMDFSILGLINRS